jgi:hypothetical protein
MSESANKLSRIFDDKFPSFSQWVEDVIINGLDVLERI